MEMKRNAEKCSEWERNTKKYKEINKKIEK